MIFAHTFKLQILSLLLYGKSKYHVYKHLFNAGILFTPFWLQDGKLNEYYSIFHGTHIPQYFVTNTLARTHIKGL